MTLLDLLILVVVLAAAVAGARRLGGTGRAGRLLGLLVGLGMGASLGAALAGLGTDPASRRVLILGGLAIGLLLGAAIGGWLGRTLGRVLVDGRLAAADRALGAVAGAGSALFVVWLLALAGSAFAGATALHPVTSLVAAAGGHSAVVDVVDSAIGRSVPAVGGDVRDVLGAL